jgi:hypothetical protein
MPVGIKIEFVYFRENNDPRLEFGIHGDYPMRILSSSCEDFKQYLLTLKKAVSRNNIIIVIGGFGENGEITDITGLAVGRRTVKYDYQKLGFGNVINAPKKLPENSLPIIDKNGVFSGVLLESGPQAIFLINENSPDKVYVMKELIAPFIFEFYNSVINK